MQLPITLTTALDLGPEPMSMAMAGPSTRFGRSLAVVIGINAYGAGISPLSSAVPDARAIADTLRAHHAFETWCLLDDEARLANLLALLRDELPRALGEHDRLLFYFAGHGIALDSDAGPAGYLVPAGARRAARDEFLPMRTVHDELVRLPVRHAFVILDCCFSGTFRWPSLRDIASDRAKIYRERYDRYIESPAWQVLTSSSADQLALDVLANDRDDAAGEHSPFALALLAGLAGAADYTGDNIITADELAVYVRERVAPAAESLNRRQVPQLFPLRRHDGGQFVFQVPDRPIALTPAPKLDESTNPYRGLEPFREHDGARFFGRGATLERLVEAVRTRPLTAVVGPSGSGKSSLIQAGLVPAARARGWMVGPGQRPGREPLAMLSAWTRANGTADAADDPVASWLASVTELGRARPDQHWLVIIDQLEELLSHGIAERDRTALLAALAHAIELAPHLHVVVTVRADAEAQFHDGALAPWWSAGRFVMPVLTRSELRDIIEKPAIATVLHFEPSRLVERLLDDVSLVPAPLPLLSFVLSELYRRCWTRWRSGVQDRALHETDYDEMGGIARALTQRATALHDQLVAEAAAYAITIRNVFTRMVAMTGGGVVRRRVPSWELGYQDPAENQRVADVLQRFHDARLISMGSDDAPDRATGAYVEPVHDELVAGWTKVAAWIDELEASVGTRLLASLGDAVRSWTASGRLDAYLWSDPRIELLRVLARHRPFLLNAGETRFVERSARRRASRRTQLIGGLAIATAVLAIVAVAALWQRERATQEADRATRNAELATSHEQTARERLAASYLEHGRALVLNGHPMQALPYLVAARADGKQPDVASPVLGLLFEQASRNLPLVTFIAHSAVVRRIAFSPDATMLVTASFDGTAQLWDAKTGAPATGPLVHGENASVDDAAFSPDGALVVTASHDKTARLWDARTGQPVLSPLRHHAQLRAAAFSSDGARIVTATIDDTTRVWDAKTGRPLTWPVAQAGMVLAVGFSRTVPRVVTANLDNTARIWDAATGTPVTGPLTHDSFVGTAAFSPDGTRVVTASHDNTARVWDATTGVPITGPFAHGGPVDTAMGSFRAVAFSSDGARVVTTSDDKTARVWDARTGKSITGPLEHVGRVYAVAISADGTRVATASEDNMVRVWDAAANPTMTGPIEHQRTRGAAVFNADGTRLVTVGEDGAARVWDATTGKPLAAPLTHRSPVRTAAFSADGTRVVTASDDHTARIWDARTGAPVTGPLEHQDNVSAAAFSADGTRVVTISDDRVRIWDASTGTPNPRLMEHARVLHEAVGMDGTTVTGPLTHLGGITAAAFSPDGARVVTASNDASARIWDAVTGMPVVPSLVHRSGVNVAAFSPDGARVVTASDDNTARVWDATTGEPLTGPLVHRGSVESAAFSPDGTRVVTASWDTSARVWDARTGEPITGPLAHRDSVEAAVFSPDGTRVVTASADHTAIVWDASTGNPLIGSLLHQDAVIAAAFSPDGTQLATASADGTVRIWTFPISTGSLEDWRARARCSPFVLNHAALTANPTPAACVPPSPR